MVAGSVVSTASRALRGTGTTHRLTRFAEFFLPNSLGGTSLLTDSSGNAKQSYQYSPFGALLNTPTDSNPFQFTGRENDGSGLMERGALRSSKPWGSGPWG